MTCKGVEMIVCGMLRMMVPIERREAQGAVLENVAVKLMAAIGEGEFKGEPPLVFNSLGLQNLWVGFQIPPFGDRDR